MTMGHRKEF